MATQVRGPSALDQALEWARRNPAQTAVGILALIVLALIVRYGLHDVAQASINGLVSGSYYALGAVGLTLVYGILKLTNFAHGDFLTFGAYMAFLATATWGLPLVAGILLAVAATAALGVGFEKVLWRPMRRRKAGLLQLLLISIGLAFVIRNGIQLYWGSTQRKIEADTGATVEFLGLRIGRIALFVMIAGFVVLLLVAIMLRRSSLGRQMRALADNFDLAETAGIDTDRVVTATWIFAGGLAGLAGVLYATALGAFNPNTGFALLLSLFAAVILGGIGNAYGALAGGIVLGLVQEWSTLVVPGQWKIAVGFGVLIIVLIVRPQGIFGRERTL